MAGEKRGDRLLGQRHPVLATCKSTKAWPRGLPIQHAENVGSQDIGAENVRSMSMLPRTRTTLLDWPRFTLRR